MASENETIADIVAKMLEFAETDSQTIGRDVLRRRIQHFARRIEAAAKREREAGAEAAQICGKVGEMIGREAAGKESLQVGNAAAMREALEKSDAALSLIAKSAWFMDANFCETREVMEAVEAIKAALAAPPRNCDVGTAEEQHARFYNFCDKVEECKECPLWRGGGLTSKCCAHWGQMPYEEGGAK